MTLLVTGLSRLAKSCFERGLLSQESSMVKWNPPILFPRNHCSSSLTAQMAKSIMSNAPPSRQKQWLINKSTLPLGKTPVVSPRLAHARSRSEMLFSDPTSQKALRAFSDTISSLHIKQPEKKPITSPRLFSTTRARCVCDVCRPLA